MTLVTSLNGTADDKTGSSLRKLDLLHEKVYLHKRHGRDRAKYADPKVIKQVKEILNCLAITPDNLTMPIENPSTRPKKRK